MSRMTVKWVEGSAAIFARVEGPETHLHAICDWCEGSPHAGYAGILRISIIYCHTAAHTSLKYLSLVEAKTWLASSKGQRHIRTLMDEVEQAVLATEAARVADAEAKRLRDEQAEAERQAAWRRDSEEEDERRAAARRAERRRPTPPGRYTRRPHEPFIAYMNRVDP